MIKILLLPLKRIYFFVFLKKLDPCNLFHTIHRLKISIL
nr:MAG TPA: hypothetical protein [Caudoviricetes sp.]